MPIGTLVIPEQKARCRLVMPERIQTPRCSVSRFTSQSLQHRRVAFASTKTLMNHVPKTRNQMRVAIQSRCVTKILALQRWSKNDFPQEFQNVKMHSFPIMYNTMGSKLDGLAVRDIFLPKNGQKAAILGVTILDRLTSEGLGHKFLKLSLLVKL